MSSLHARAKELFLAALSRPADDRDAFLATACGDDIALRQEVESLLRFHDEEDVDDDPAPSPPAQEAFAAGDVFAGRYRMITRIGRGGMGDVWQADDLVLETPVALKLIRSASPAARARIRNEVRLARQITHPAVCRVFDVGDAGDEVFFSMEFVRGEDLAALLRRVGRLPSEKVIEIAHQLCGGLAAAHAQSVLHRDLKPANVLIDQDGQVRITDFGIAVTRNDIERHTMIGTPGYMAPEQLSTGAPVTERTDVYALGLVLYELVTGQRRASRSGAAGDAPWPSMLVPNVNPQLERIILDALAPDPKDRPPSALAMAARLPDPETAEIIETAVISTARSLQRTRWWIAAAAVAGVVAVVAAVAPLFERRVGALTERDTIVLADFLNTTGDPVFDGTLKVALAIALEQSPFLKVFPDERVRDTLRLMGRSPDARVTPSIAREVARRERLKALLSSSIAPLGANYVIAIEAINAESGDVMAREQLEVPSKEQVLTSLGAATSRVRAKLGESLASIQRFDAPLPTATTTSLEALHSYALALDQGRTLPRLESIPHLRRAIELDPNFALALAMLSGMYSNTGQTALAPEYARRAFALRDRVTERERYYITWRYYRDAAQSWDEGLALAREWAQSYPREANAFNSVGLAAEALGRQQQAIEPLREAIRLDPKFVAPPENLGTVLAALNRFDEARNLLESREPEVANFIGIRRTRYLLAFIRDDADEMARQLSASAAMPEGPWASNWQPRVSAFSGRLHTAHEEFRRAVQITGQAGFKELAALFSVQDAESHAVVGQCVDARNEVTAALALSRDNSTLEIGSRSLAVCGADAAASSLANELTTRFPDATLTVRVSLPVTNAALAMERKDPRTALQLLESVRPYDHAPVSEFWPAYLRGQAYLALMQGREAAAEFQAIVDRRGESADSVHYPLAHLGLARAATLLGDVVRARVAYQTFFRQWKDADPDLQPLREARIEFVRLPNAGS